jgi:hypothetical protein
MLIFIFALANASLAIHAGTSFGRTVRHIRQRSARGTRGVLERSCGQPAFH